LRSGCIYDYFYTLRVYVYTRWISEEYQKRERGRERYIYIGEGGEGGSIHPAPSWREKPLGKQEEEAVGNFFFYLKGPVASAAARDPATTTWGLLESSRNLFRWMDGASSSSFQPFLS
jgi:hypothetical protein